MKLKTRCYWTLANFHGDLWHFYQNGPLHHKLWQRKSDVPKRLRSDVRLVRVEVREKKLSRKKRSVDALISSYVGGRYRFRKAKEAVLARINASRKQ